jgi:hypothetical protein
MFHVQGARGIGTRFLKLSPASAVSPIMTKFSKYTPTPPATQYRCQLPARLKGHQQESHRGVIVKKIRADEGRWRIKSLKTKDMRIAEGEHKLILTHFSENLKFF